MRDKQAIVIIVVSGFLTLHFVSPPSSGEDPHDKLPSSAENVLARTEAGDYVLELLMVAPADPKRFRTEFLPDFEMKPVRTDSADRSSYRFRRGGTRAKIATEGSGSGSGVGGGAGGAGRFYRPNTLLGIQVVTSQGHTPVRGARMGAGYRLTDNRGKSIESTLPDSFLVDYPMETRSTLTPLPVFVPAKSAEIAELEGLLVVVPGEVQRVVFTPEDIDHRPRKRVGKRAVQIESFTKKNGRIELVVLVGSDANKTLESRRVRDKLRLQRPRITVTIEDTKGTIYRPVSTGQTTSAEPQKTERRVEGRFGQSVFIDGRSQKKVTCTFESLPNEAIVKHFVVTMRTRTGAIEKVPFRFTNVSLRK